MNLIIYPASRVLHASLCPNRFRVLLRTTSLRCVCFLAAHFYIMWHTIVQGIITFRHRHAPGQLPNSQSLSFRLPILHFIMPVPDRFQPRAPQSDRPCFAALHRLPVPCPPALKTPAPAATLLVST